MKGGAISNIHVSGGLLSEHFIRLMKEDTCSFIYAQPDTFVTPSSEDDKPPKKGEYDLKVAQAWADLKERWDIYGHKLTEIDPADVRRLWVKPLLEALGFDLIPLHKYIELSDQLKLKFSHRGWGPNPRYHNPPIVHVVPPSPGIDVRTERGKPSPHDAVQEYLNRHDDLWALVTNGLYLRVLRDYHHTYVKGYVEFDLEAIFITRSFHDFQALYRIAHASRFTSAVTGNLYLEEYFQHSQLVGEKVGAKLRENVAKAVMALGNGFLDEYLLAELRADEARCHQLYEEILRVVYRIIFLLYAEQRGMLTGNVQAPNYDLYLEEYSISALREHALTDYRALDQHVDYWVGLRSTFEILRRGSSELGIYPYGGMLFDTDRDDYVAQHACKNSELLEAIYYLTTTEIDDTIHRISYADIDVEEVGAIYESLLENTPQITRVPESINNIDYPANSFILDPRALTRKTTGSYYTDRALIQELIKSALEPVLKDRLNNAGYTTEDREKALLSIKICDPACGSGAFLIATCNRLAIELARIRAGDTILTDTELQSARRDVLQHCIYGVDLNPMAIELVKVSLWINALVKDKPLNFLDHHLKCGNSLIGAMPELVDGGIRTEAFAPVEKDDKKVANDLKKLNRTQLSNATLSYWEQDECAETIPSEKFAALNVGIEISPADVEEKNRKYKDLISSDAYFDTKILAHLWTSSFFWPLVRVDRQDDCEREGYEFPTQQALTTLVERGSKVFAPWFLKQLDDLAHDYSFFHWYLEFPEAFGRLDPGFDCVLGNPPWETMETKETEFFRQKAPAIARAKNAAERKDLIASLVQENAPLSEEFKTTKRRIECERKFLSNSSRFRLTAKGKINTYAVFAELGLQIIRETGRAGIIVPSGIVSDATTAEFCSEIVDNGRLASLYDFENRKKLFPIDSRIKFCLLTLTGKSAPVREFDTAFFLQSVDDIEDEARHFKLNRDDIRLINPVTQTFPIFRWARDAELNKRIYSRIPILRNDEMQHNDWRISFSQGLFNMASDSSLFETERALSGKGFHLDGNIFEKGDAIYWPLYEGKMMMTYNHRLSSAATEHTMLDKDDIEFVETSMDELKDYSFCVTPRYWVEKKQVVSRLPSSQSFLIGYRDITNTTNRRTAIFSIIPCTGVGHTINLAFFDAVKPLKMALFLANVNSIIFDYVVRQKLGGTHLTQSILKQLPVLPPTAYTDELMRLIAPRVLELCYTAWDVQGFARDLGYVDAQSNKPLPPFQWDENRRLHLQAELDAIYTHLYGVSREDLDYILGTFPIVKRKDEEKYKSYLTKELILQYYDQYIGKITAVKELDHYDK